MLGLAAHIRVPMSLSLLSFPFTTPQRDACAAALGPGMPSATCTCVVDVGDGVWVGPGVAQVVARLSCAHTDGAAVKVEPVLGEAAAAELGLGRGGHLRVGVSRDRG